jgi:RNA polymerase sigma-70 factor (ECF subfamily)
MWRQGVIRLGQAGAPPPDIDHAEADAEARSVAAARHDPAAFAPLYRAYFDPVYRYCLRSLGDRDAAADSTQEVFARALKALPRTEIAAFRPWLFTIAHNVVTDRHRQRARRPDPASLAHIHDRPDPAPSPEETALSEEARQSVHFYLARLSDEQRAVVELRLADLSGPEVAAVLGRSLGSVKIAQYRAFRRLRDLLEAAERDGEQHGAH